MAFTIENILKLKKKHPSLPIIFGGWYGIGSNDSWSGMRYVDLEVGEPRVCKIKRFRSAIWTEDIKPLNKIIDPDAYALWNRAEEIKVIFVPLS